MWFVKCMQPRHITLLKPETLSFKKWMRIEHSASPFPKLNKQARILQREQHFDPGCHPDAAMWKWMRIDHSASQVISISKLQTLPACHFLIYQLYQKWTDETIFPILTIFFDFLLTKKIPFSKKQFSNTELWLIFNGDKITLIAQKYKKSNFFATMKMFLTLTFRL